MSLIAFIKYLFSPINLGIYRRTYVEDLKRELTAYRADNPDLARDARFQQYNLSNLSERVDALYAEVVKHQITSRWSLYDNLTHLFQGDYPVKTRYCPICNFKDNNNLFTLYVSHCIFGGGKLTRYQCPECDVIFGPDKMLTLSPEMLSEEYQWHYRVFSEGDSTELEKRAFYAMDPHPEGLYLNWGSGNWSNTLQQLRAEGWNIYGYEPYSSSVGPSEYCITDFETISGMSFDGIFSNNVLEHLANPIEEIKLMRKLLKPEGILLHATPCFEYLYEFTRFHLFFFLGRSREVLAEKTGMKLERYFSDGQFMYILLK
jgi:hypothetical protein